MDTWGIIPIGSAAQDGQVLIAVEVYKVEFVGLTRLTHYTDNPFCVFDMFEIIKPLRKSFVQIAILVIEKLQI